MAVNALEKRVRPDVHGLIQGSNSLNVEKKHLTQINKIALVASNVDPNVFFNQQVVLCLQSWHIMGAE